MTKTYQVFYRITLCEPKRIGGGAQFCYKNGAVSVCGEAGIGFGVKGQLDSGGVTKDGTKIGAELSAKCGPAGIGVGASWDSNGCKDIFANGDLGFLTFEGDKIGGKQKIETPKLLESSSLGCGIQGKANVKTCKGGKAGKVIGAIFAPFDLSILGAPRF